MHDRERIRPRFLFSACLVLFSLVSAVTASGESDPDLATVQTPTTRLPSDVLPLELPLAIIRENGIVLLWTAVLILSIGGVILLLLDRLRRSKRSERVLADKVAHLESQRTELRNSRERYRLVAEASRDVIWEWDIVRNAIHFPERWFEYYGIESGSILSLQDWLRLMEAEDHVQFEELLHRHLRGHSEVFELQVRMRIGGGALRHLTVSGKALIDETGFAHRMAGSVTDITENLDQQQRIHELAYLDSLTGLPNKTMLSQLMDEAVHELTHRDDRLALIHLDVDNFKLINDSFGHRTGDFLLMELANRLKSFTGDAQWVSRLGGDEFAVLLPYTEGDSPVDGYCRQLLSLLGGSFRVDGQQFHVSVSIGVSVYPEDGTAFGDLLMNADTALNHAKSLRGNRYTYFRKSMNDAVMNKVKMQTDLRRAFDNHELILFYQAKYSVADKSICGFEALLRWQSAEGLIPPNRFIGAAEETGLIIPIGAWVIQEACQFIKRLDRQGYTDIRVSVNVSVLQLTQGNLADTIRRTIEEAGISADRLCVEITESVLMETYEECISMLTQIRRLGVRIELDDFGNGYSSLGYLKEMPLHTLKIDKTFIDAISKDNDGTPLTDTIIQLGHQLGLEVVAEGVEHKWQYDSLCRGKCDVLQGFLLSRPVPEKQALMLLESTREAGRAPLLAGIAVGAGDVIPFRKRER